MTDTLVEIWIRRLKNRPIIAVVVVLALVIVGVASVTESIEKLGRIFVPEKSQSNASVSMTLPDNVSVREAIDLLVQQRQASAHFGVRCSEELLDRRLMVAV